MKTLLAVTLFVCTCTSFVMAGSPDYLLNQSAEFIRTLNRNHAVDSADAVNYNPAGTAFMKDGIYLNLGNQFVLKDYSAQDRDPTHIWNDKKYESDKPTYVLPNLYLVYKKNNWAAYTAFTIPGGGGELEFTDGVPGLRDLFVNFLALDPAFQTAVVINTGSAANIQPIAVGEASNIKTFIMKSYHVGWTAGYARKLHDIISISAGIRYIIYAKKEFKANFKGATSYSQFYSSNGRITKIALDGNGFNGIIGLNINPFKELNIGIRYEMETKMDWDTKISGSSIGTSVASSLGYANGRTDKRSLPALFGVGISYEVLPNMSIAYSLTYYFIKSAEWKFDSSTGVATDAGRDWDNGYETGITAEYKITPAFLASIGYLYTKMGSNSRTFTDVAINLDSQGIAFGVKYEAIPGLELNLGFAITFYDEGIATSSGADHIAYNISTKALAVGVQYRI